jgi:hypothetical protein
MWVQVDPAVLTNDVITENPDGTLSVDPEVYEDDNNWVRITTDPDWQIGEDYAEVGESADVTGDQGQEYVPGETVEEQEETTTTTSGGFYDPFILLGDQGQDYVPDETIEETEDTTTTTTTSGGFYDPFILLGDLIDDLMSERDESESGSDVVVDDSVFSAEVAREEREDPVVDPGPTVSVDPVVTTPPPVDPGPSDATGDASEDFTQETGGGTLEGTPVFPAEAGREERKDPVVDPGPSSSDAGDGTADGTGEDTEEVDVLIPGEVSRAERKDPVVDPGPSDAAGDVDDTDDDTDGTGDGTGEGEGAGEGTGDGDGTGDGEGDGDGDGEGLVSSGMFKPPSSGFQPYMGGIGYTLPTYVPVLYQPKDYDVELNRIIRESLFEGIA